MPEKRFPKPLKKYLGNLAKELGVIFYLHEWTKDLVFCTEEKEGGVAAEISTDHKYFSLTITLYPPIMRMWDKKDYQEITRCFVHEMCHVLTDPLYKQAVHAVSNSGAEFLEDIREQQTQRISTIVFDLLPKSLYTLKKTNDTNNRFRAAKRRRTRK